MGGVALRLGLGLLTSLDHVGVAVGRLQLKLGWICALRAVSDLGPSHE